MNKWKEVMIDNLCEVTSSKRIFYEEYVTSGIPFFRSKEIIELSNNQLVSTDLFITKEKFNSINDKFGAPAKDDILLTSVGTLGVPYLVPGTFEFYFKDGNLTWFRKWKKEVNPLFFYWWLKSPQGYQALLDISIGSTQQALTISGLKGINLFLPSLSEQERIAEVLSSLDDKIDLLQRQNKTLEEMAETLFRQWFESEESEPETLLSEFLDFLEGPGLRHWQYTLSGVRFINIRLIDKGELHIETANFVAEEEAYGRYKHFLLQAKDMVVSTSGTLGKSAIVRKYHLPLMLNTSVIRFRPTDGKSYSFMYQYLQSKAFLDHLETTASGSVQANFGPSHLKMMKVSFPTKEKIQVFSSRLDPLYDKINHNYSQIKQLEQTLDTLLPKLMSGEVMVEI